MNRSPGKSRSRLHSHTHSDTRAPSLSVRVHEAALILLVGAPVLPLLVVFLGSISPFGSAAAQSAPSSDAASSPAGAATTADPDSDLLPIAEAVRGLGDPSFREREAASRALLSHGSAALPALRAALESDDAEVRHRAEDLIDRISRRGTSGPAAAGGLSTGGLSTGGRSSTLEERLERLRGEVLPLGARELGFGGTGFGDARFEESLRRLDELFENLDRVAPPMTESFRSRMERMDRDLEAHLAELHERILRAVEPRFGGPLEERFFGGDAQHSGRARIQIWRDGAPLLDSTRSYDFSDVASLGIAVESVHPSLRAHLPIPAGEGLTVGHVTPESAAARAGLEEHDILLKLNGAPIVSVADLRSRSESREGRQTLTLEVLRRGTPRTVEISFPGAGGR